MIIDKKEGKDYYPHEGFLKNLPETKFWATKEIGKTAA